MIIPITLSTEANAKLPSGLAQISNDEIILIELQGALDVNIEASPTERNGKFVGKLTVDDAMVRTPPCKPSAPSHSHLSRNSPRSNHDNSSNLPNTSIFKNIRKRQHS